MSREEGLLRHRSIIHQIKKKPSTFDEVQDFLRLKEDMTEDRLTCSLRTFQRDLREIKNMYDVVIKYDKSQRVYYIAHDGRESHSERLMETFDLFNAIKMGNSFGNQLIFENRRALGTEHMYGLLHAIKNRQEVDFTYEKFYETESTKRSVQPIAIKESRNRWYLVGRDAKDGVIKNFALDRVSGLDITNRKFKEIKNYNPIEEFKHTFGIINGTGEKAQKIVLSFTPTEGRYINSLPLHHSQQEVLKNSREHQFEYTLVPTYDFKMEILSYGNTVKVLEPESLKKDIVESLKKALASYK